MKNKKIALLLISASMSILVLAGCSTTKAPTTTTKAPTTTTMKSSIKGNHTKKANSTSMMKTLYSDTLKSLVTSKTITQTQSNKVLADLTKKSQVKGNANKLSTLVKNRIITQSQADIINKTIKTNTNKLKNDMKKMK